MPRPRFQLITLAVATIVSSCGIAFTWSAMDELGNSYLVAAKYKQAASRYTKNITYLEKKDPNDVRIARTIDGLTIAYEILRVDSELERLYRRSLAIYEANADSTRPEMAAVAYRLGSFYQDIGYYQGADSLLRVALDLDRQLHPQDHPYIEGDLGNLAVLHFNHGNLLASLPILVELAALEKGKIDYWPRRGKVLEALIFSYRELGLLTEAAAIEEEVIEVIMRANVFEPSLPMHYNRYAGMLKDLGRATDADAARVEANRIQAEIRGTNPALLKRVQEEYIEDSRNQEAFADSLLSLPWMEAPDLPPLPIGGLMGIQRNTSYPPAARASRIEGTVDVQTLVNRKGRVTESFVGGGINGLNNEAMRAVRKSRFVPALYRGLPISAWIVLPIQFKLPYGAE